MTSTLAIQRGTEQDAPEIGVMVGELLAEIVEATGIRSFNFDLTDTVARCADFLRREKYFVFVARANHQPAGFISLYESYSLYAEGAFGTIAELYVRPEFRSIELGRRLISRAMDFGSSCGWRRLEVTTPPLPTFDRTLTFYERQGFSVTGGRKLAFVL